jgi:hypothetical protein
MNPCSLQVIARFPGGVISSTTAVVGSADFWVEASTESALGQVPAGKTGTAAWGGSTATITLGAGHGLIDSDIVAVFWGTSSCRTSLIVSGTTTTTITVTNSDGNGTSLPTTSSATCIVGKVLKAAGADFDADTLAFLGFGASQLVAFEPMTISDAICTSGDPIQVIADSTYTWLTGQTAEVTGLVAYVNLYCGAETAATVKIGGRLS